MKNHDFTSKRSCWPVLRPSWGDLGAAGGGQNRCFSQCVFSIMFEKSCFRIKMVILAGLGAILVPLGAILGASWADLGPTWAPKRAQKGAQDDPKTSPKRHRFFSRSLVRFWCDFGAPRGPAWRPKGVAFQDFELLHCAQAPGPLPVYMYIRS